uniref:Protein AKNAD1 n=1 Tax=Anabas testudineus TaxID=64144 RepID=A0A7N6FAC8_ANATE
MHRAQSSPGMLEVISRVLEDSILPSEKPYVFKHEDKQTPPALVHHLQAEYDKLLTKYAEAENLIDQMRLGTNTQSPSEMIAYSDTEYHQHELNDDDHQENPVERSHLGSLASHLPPSEIIVEKGETAAQSNIKGVNKASPSKVQEGLSDGDRMTTELSDIISHFMQKVKDFKLSVSNMSVSTAEQQMMLRSMMEAQDQLERKYISKKEEHRALEMQNYMGLSRNTGTFDPDRLVEGDIFRIGMHLEDIKEMIDKNVCEQISPPHSSSTPTSMKEMLHVKPSALCISTPSTPPSLHEGPSASFSAARYNMEIQKVEGEQEGVEETSMAHADGGLEQSCKVMSADSFLRCNSCPSWSPHSSLEDLNTQAAEDEDGNEEERNSVSSEGIDHTNILAYLSGSSSTSLQREWTPDSSCNTLDSVLNPEGEHVGLAVEVSCSSYTPRDSDSHSPLEPLLITSSRIVSPETDSGFGSSYLNQSGSGSYPPNLLTESVETQNEDLGSSDSEGSCFNLQTAIHSVSLTSQQRTSPHPSVQTQVPGEAAAVEWRVDSATKEPPERQQRSDANLPAQFHNHISASAVSTTMDTEKICSQTHCCSCNGEAILALQSEVSRLKKNLEEGLVQLPHLAQKMDYLTSKYKQDRQESRSKTRPRIHQRPATNSVWSGSGQNSSNIISGSAKIEDWISSDMEPSRSKDSGDTADSDLMLEFCNSPVGGRRGSGIHSEPEFECRPHQTLKSCRGLEGSVKTFSRSSSKGGKAGVAGNDAKQRARTAIMENFYSKERRPSFSSPSLQKPLLQVNYGSSSSLPASYKVREIPQQSTSHHRKRSTQSDTALLPSNVYFQRTLSPVSVPSKTSSRTGRHKGSKEEDMNRTLDKAIEVARSMKRTTDRMAKRLSADLAKAQLYRKQHNIQPLGGGNHHTL